jgi:hypothetical protein
MNSHLGEGVYLLVIQGRPLPPRSIEIMGLGENAGKIFELKIGAKS